MEVTGFSDVFGGYSLPACISLRNLRPKWQLNDFGPFRLAMWPCACRVTIVPSNCAAGSSSCIGCSLNLCVSASVSHGKKIAKNVHKTRHRCSNSLVNSIQFNRIFKKISMRIQSLAHSLTHSLVHSITQHNTICAPVPSMICLAGSSGSSLQARLRWAPIPSEFQHLKLEISWNVESLWSLWRAWWNMVKHGGTQESLLYWLCVHTISLQHPDTNWNCAVKFVKFTHAVREAREMQHHRVQVLIEIDD